MAISEKRLASSAHCEAEVCGINTKEITYDKTKIRSDGKGRHRYRVK